MAAIPYNAVGRLDPNRSNWGTVSSTVPGNGGIWRRRPNPTGTSQSVASPTPNAGNAQAWWRLSRIGGMRGPMGGNGPTGGALALGGTLLGTTDGGSGLDAGVGNPAPSIRICGNGRYARRLKVTAGTRFVFVDALQPDSRRARPKMRIYAAPTVGIPGDITVTAAVSDAWVTLSSGALTITTTGGIWVELLNPEPRACDSCWFDNLFVR